MLAHAETTGVHRRGAAGLAIAVALGALGGLSCADVSYSTDASTPADSQASPLDGAPQGSSICHVPKDEERAVLAAQLPEVLILLDRSGSMDTAFGSSTRQQAMGALHSELVAMYGAHVHFGYQEFPGRQGCAGQTELCCVSPPVVAPADGNTVSVLSAIAAAGPPEGATPTAAALQAALAYFKKSGAPAASRYVLLATDGSPSCTLAGSLQSGEAPEDPACADALSQAEALVAASVRVIVLGMGPELASTSRSFACLDRLAQVGGAAASPGSPGYYMVENAEQLMLAVERLFGGTVRPSCVLEFPVPLKESSGIEVYLDGQRIPQSSQNGWQPEPREAPKRVLVTGDYCHKIETFQVTEVVAFYLCPPGVVP